MTNDILNGIWPEWKIEGRLGRGSYGTVYKAVRIDHSVESHAAIKVISIPQEEWELDSMRSEGLSEDGIRDYLREVLDDLVNRIEAMKPFRRVQNIVGIEDYKVVEKKEAVGWDIYIRMELLTPFFEYISDRTMSEEDVIKLGVDICEAIRLCTGRKIIHFDIKPHNIYLDIFGNYKLGGFRFLKIENKENTKYFDYAYKGAQNFQPPEYYMSLAPGANVFEYYEKSEIYQVGITLYWLMNKKRLPFLSTQEPIIRINEMSEATHRRLDGEKLPAPCDASTEFSKIILRACSYKQSKRFETITQMRQELKKLLYPERDYMVISDRFR